MELNNAIKDRWSPRKFSEKPVTEEMVNLLFEAARLAPSSRNEQPWKFFYANRNNTRAFDEMTALLIGNNADWAKDAQVLIVSVFKTHYDHKNRLNNNAKHDIGAANFSIALQAAEMGLQVHPMGGFDKTKAIELLELDIEKYEPAIMMAVGFPDETKPFSEETKQRIQQHQTRKTLKEIVLQLK